MTRTICKRCGRPIAVRHVRCEKILAKRKVKKWGIDALLFGYDILFRDMEDDDDYA